MRRIIDEKRKFINQLRKGGNWRIKEYDNLTECRYINNDLEEYFLEYDDWSMTSIPDNFTFYFTDISVCFNGVNKIGNNVLFEWFGDKDDDGGLYFANLDSIGNNVLFNCPKVTISLNRIPENFKIGEKFKEIHLEHEDWDYEDYETRLIEYDEIKRDKVELELHRRQIIEEI